MPTTRTRLQLATGARVLADAVGDRNVTDTMVVDWIADAVRELWRVKVDTDPDTHAIRVTIATTAGTQSYNLPTDFMQIRRLDRINGSQYELIHEAPPLLELDFSTNGGDYDDVCYRVMAGGLTGAGQLWILPDPGTGSYSMWYVQSPQALANDAATLDCTHGEDRYVQAAVAARICERQDRDATPHRAEQARAIQSIINAVAKRSSGRAKRITDTRSQPSGWRRYPRP